jgi:hypothetical protein
MLKQLVQIVTIVLQMVKETHLYSSGNSVLTVTQGNGGCRRGLCSLLISVPDFPGGLLLVTWLRESRGSLYSVAKTKQLYKFSRLR